MKVVGLSGSLRSGSYNSGLLRAARDVAPAGVEVELRTLHGIPMYDEDLEAAGDPPAVRDLKEAIVAADAVLIATPEYNHSIPGVLKNAIDWLSRPPRQSVLDLKPVAIVGATTGIGGTARAQLAVRESLAFPGAQAMPAPELMVTRARDKFDADGRLVDEETREGLRAILYGLQDWAAEVRAALAAA